MEGLEILFEDKDLLVINKQSGLMVERDKYKNPSVQDLVAAYFNTLKVSQNTILGIVHRIDRPVSGVLLIAKKVSVLRDLNTQFEQGKIEKIYHALVENPAPQQEELLQHYLHKNVKNKIAIIYNNSRKHAVKCELFYKKISSINDKDVLEIHPHTGKYHQIRAQLSFIGCPIIGDTKYGSAIPYKNESICLHAHTISFEHPVSKEKMQITAENPTDWKYVNSNLIN